MAEEEVVTTVETGAEPESQTAEVGGTTEEVSEGAETQETQAAESDKETGESDESGTAEGGTEETENKDKGAHQKSFEERLKEVEEKAEKKAQEYIERIERERQQREAALKPSYAELDYQAINRDMNKSYAREQEILNEISLDPEQVDPALTQELRQIRIWRQQVESAIEQNERKKAEFLQKQQEKQQADAFWKARNSEIQETIKIMQEHEKVSDDVVDAIRGKWGDLVKADPLLQRQFDDGIRAGRITETVKWASDMARKALTEAAQKTIDKKESGKEKQIGGDSKGEAVSFDNIKNWNDLEKLHSKDINRFVREHPKRFAEIKQKRFK